MVIDTGRPYELTCREDRSRRWDSWLPITRRRITFEHNSSIRRILIVINAEVASAMRKVSISTEPLELYKVLKFDGMTGSGGEAKLVIADGLVKLTGLVETRKRKKVVAGDVIEFAGEKICLQRTQVTTAG